MSRLPHISKAGGAATQWYVPGYGMRGSSGIYLLGFGVRWGFSPPSSARLRALFHRTPTVPAEQQYWTPSMTCIHQMQEEAWRHQGSCISASLIKNIHPALPPLPPRAATAQSCLAGVTRTKELLKCPMLPSHWQSQRTPTLATRATTANTWHKAIRYVLFQKWHVYPNTTSDSLRITLWLQNAVKINEKSARSWREWKKKVLMGAKLSNGHLIP